MATSLRRMRRDCLTVSVSRPCMLLCFLLLLCIWSYFVDVTVEYRSLSDPGSYPTPVSSRDSTLSQEGYHKSIHEEGAKIRVDETVQWQVTDGLDLLYLFNAYYDDVEQPEVRLVAMGDEKHIKRRQRVFCHLWSQSNQLPTKVVGYLDHVPDAHSKRYTTMFAHCPIEDGTKPTEVSVTFNDTDLITNKNLYQSQYLVFHDMDEVLLPLQHRSWHQLLDNLTSAFPDGAAFGFRCSYVNDLFPETPERLPRDLALPAKRLGLSFLLRTRRENFVYADKWRSKMVVIPERVATTGIHCIWRARKNTKEYFMDPALGLNFHFRSKWVLNDTVDDTSLTDRFASELVTKVQSVLEEVTRS